MTAPSPVAEAASPSPRVVSAEERASEEAKRGLVPLKETMFEVIANVGVKQARRLLKQALVELGVAEVKPLERAHVESLRTRAADVPEAVWTAAFEDIRVNKWSLRHAARHWWVDVNTLRRRYIKNDAKRTRMGSAPVMSEKGDAALCRIFSSCGRRSARASR